jgi:hypothetical protein
VPADASTVSDAGVPPCGPAPVAVR